jgi:hypothetical protein
MKILLDILIIGKISPLLEEPLHRGTGSSDRDGSGPSSLDAKARIKNHSGTIFIPKNLQVLFAFNLNKINLHCFPSS